MIDIRVKLQASIFANVSDISPTTDNIAALIEMYRYMGFIPSTFNEINLNTGAPHTRIKLQSQNKEWLVNIATQRIDITKNPIDPRGTNIGTPEDFTNSCIEMFQRLLARYRRNVTRLAFIEEFLWSQKSEEALSEIFNRLFVPTEFYRQNVPFEWNWRTVSNTLFNINNSDVQTHAITAFDRVSGEMKGEGAIHQTFDRVKVMFDINTKPIIDRNFEIQDIENFFNQALPLRDTL